MENNQGKGQTMKRRIISIIIVVLVLGTTSPTAGVAVEVSVATDKPTYFLDEDVVVSVTAYNPNPEPAVLSFESYLQASYLIDDVFDWTEGKQFLQLPTGVIIEPYSAHTWDLTHGSDEVAIYPLEIGSHTVIGEVVGYGQSTPVEFEVVPEPATILLLGVGVFAIRAKNRKSSRHV